MSTHKLSRLLALVLALVLALGCLTPISAVQPQSENETATGEAFSGNPDAVKRADEPGEPVEIMVQLDGETEYVKTADLELATKKAPEQLATMKKAELTIESTLSSQIEVENYYSLLFNGFSFVGEEWMVEAINEIPGYTAFVSPTLELIEPTTTESTTLTPSMGTSTGLVGATNAWDYGYTGEGMVVAVIDTGIRPTHEAFSVMPSNPKIDEDYLENVFNKYGDKLHAGNGSYSADMYYNEKLPFNWDYFDNDAIPNHTASDHGTHVAGIAAGNNGGDFRGIAPDAQVVTMQVFTDAGGAAFSTLLLALEDCAYLGVDTINMSLGATSGFTAYSYIDDALEMAYDALEAAGVTVCAAAGNDGHAQFWNNFGDYYYSQYRWLAANPDIGLVSAPATFPGSLAVASVVNMDTSTAAYLTAYGQEYSPVSSVYSAPVIGSLEAKEYDLVWVGLGKAEDYEGLDVTGKIILAKRGDNTFTDKATNALNNGAAGILVMNNVSGTVSTGVDVQIPYGVLSLEDGEKLYANLVDGQGKITVVRGLAYSSVQMATTSSWGTTSDLKIKPEIAAPGDKIRSSIGFSADNSYATWSGTSMATPHIAGGMLLIKERLQKLYPSKSASEINELAYAFLMSTAHQVSGFVRQQGAGLMDLDAALTTEAYLTVPGVQRPKLELDDSEDGTFTFSFTVNNISKTAKTFKLDYSALTESVSEFDYDHTVVYEENYAARFGVDNPETVTLKVLTGTPLDVSDLCTLEGAETIVVPANGKKTVTLTLSCTDELMDYFEENCEAGMYLEGFIKLIDTDAEGTNLSIPFLGYVGDWDEPAIFDVGTYWQREVGEISYQQSTTSYYKYVGYGTLEQGLGLNYYADMYGETYLADRNAISPNGDAKLDGVDYIEFSMLRNAAKVTLTIRDAEDNVLETLYDGRHFIKEYYAGGSMNGGVTYTGLTLDFTGENMAENETVYMVLEGWLDRDEYLPENNKNGQWIIPITKDTVAPAVKVVDGGIEVIDTNYTAYYAIYADEARTELIDEGGVFAMERGEATPVAVDLDTYYVFTADYARNEAFYKVEGGVVYSMDWASTFTSRPLAGQSVINWNEGIYEYTWLEFNPEAPNAVTYLSEPSYEQTDVMAEHSGWDIHATEVGVDGTLYASNLVSLLTIDPETFERTLVADFWCADGIKCNVYNLTINPDTFEMYAYAWIYGVPGANGNNYWFAKVDLETAELIPMWASGQFDYNGMAFIDGERLFVQGFLNNYHFIDYRDGTVLDTFDQSLKNPLYGGTEVGFYGFAQDIIYDKELNCVYISDGGSWFRDCRYNAAGIIKFDLNTRTATLHTVGNDAGYQVFGLYFRDEVKPQDFYVVKTLIDAIGEVTYNSGEAIDAAREAYDNLTAEDKARVDNYEDLLSAEHRYAIVKAEHSSYLVAKYYAKVVLAELEAYDTSDLNAHQLDLFNEAVESFKAALAEAKTSEEIAAALEALFAVIDNLDTLCPSAEFSDVDAKAWYHEAIDYAVGNGLMNGMGDGTFAPNAEMTRAQLVTVLYRMAGSPSVEGIENPFKDVAENAWFVDAVLWAADNGIVNGTSADTFSPNAAATREQFVTILYRYTAGEAVEDDKLADVPDADRISDYAREAMNWAVANGLIQGDDKGQVNPLNSATRAEIATLLMRFCESN